MARRYILLRPGASEDTINWLEQLETWSQRTRHKLEWLVEKTEAGQYTAKIKIDGELVSQIVGTGNTPRSARIKLVQQVDRAEPAILTI